MNSIIHELQSDAAKSNYSISELLRKAKIVATKLDLDDFLIWIDSELNGYKNKGINEIPSSRCQVLYCHILYFLLSVGLRILQLIETKCRNTRPDTDTTLHRYDNTVY